MAKNILFLPLQTKKGKNSLQVAAMSEMMTQWLLDLKQRGLATDREVHQAAPKGTKECVVVIVIMTSLANLSRNF